ncbi:hypothetical protein F5148DRAFT_1245257 [Russula earlei]|uniref:Uncharacterized protein n=1 Tax=Russula earlei TaxID=71964 RepID=A0ACC0TX06_9AGAM|nr:hypothetical protein F5148DRAFT_1245257 [Russula earlei]
MIFIWAASINTFQQNQGPRIDHQRFRYPTAAIHILPYEVLLEIFDSYRQTYLQMSNYERRWNSNQGWFKLAHVCREWRRVVLTSPSRLHLRLVFTQHRTRRALEMKNLPPLPIIVDYGDGAWTVNSENRMVSALAYPNRVCGIVFRGRERGLKRLLAAMNRPFPALESLELNFQAARGLNLLTLFLGVDFPPPFFRTHLSHIRRLTFTGRVTTFLSQMLSYTKSLVDLTMTVDRVSLPGGKPLLAHLQDMPFLRHLEVAVRPSFSSMPSTNFPSPPGGTRTAFLLSKLTRFRFIGQTARADEFVAGLSTPSLQDLYVSLRHDTPTLPVSHLSAFIQDTGILFFAAQLEISQASLSISMLAHSHPTEDPAFRVAVTKTSSITQIGGALSSMLTTVEDVFVTPSLSAGGPSGSPLKVDRVALSELFEQLRNVKTLRVRHGLESEVAAILQQDRQLATELHTRDEPDMDPTAPSSVPSSERQSPFDILPSLKEIQVFESSPEAQISRSEPASGLGPFAPFVTARKHAGRPVELFWNTDRVLPRYFGDANL